MSGETSPKQLTGPESTSEIGALKAVTEALDPLEAEARRRILNYLNDLYGFSRKRERSDSTTLRKEAARADTVDSRQYGDFPDLFEAGGNPTGEKPRALLAAYWLQVIQGTHPFFGADLNRVLRPSGRVLSKVSRPISGLKSSSPSLIVEEGKKSNRPLYKLTTAGIKEAEKMLG